MKGAVSAIVVAVVVMVASACTQVQTSQNPSPSDTTTPSSTPTSSPTDNPTPSSSPSSSPVASPPVASPPASLTMGSLPFHSGEVGVAYSPVALNASGGTAPYTWSIGGGFLPAGLYLTADGFSGGQPTTAGTYTFTLRVDDSAGASTSVPASIVIVPHLSAAGLCTRGCAVEQGCDTACGAFGTQSGGLPPYKYKVTAGFLPFGMGLRGLNLTGVIPPPAFSGGIDVARLPVPFAFSVSVTDSLGVAANVHAVFGVFPHIAFSNPQPDCFTGGNGCTVTLAYVLGTPGGTAEPAISSILCASPPCDGLNGDASVNNLPDGFTVNVDSGARTVTLFFPPSTTDGGRDWTGSVLLTISDQSPCGVGGARCSASQVVTVSLG